MDKAITSSDGHDRLSLQYEEGYFRALIWSSEHGRDWRSRAVITQTDFQRGFDRERWVAELHSFNPSKGTAIVKVGEMEVPQHKAGPGGFRRCVYSWREWDLLVNREIRMIRVCEDPFEAYDATIKDHRVFPHALSESSLLIDCKDEHWDDSLYAGLYNRRRIELTNLHPSYEGYMNQLAQHYCMEFIGHFAANRGEFKPRT